MYLKENLKHLRKSKGLSLEKLAKELSMSSSNVADYEKGRTTPPLKTLMAVCDMFKIKMDELLYNDLVAEEMKKEGRVPNNVFSETTGIIEQIAINALDSKYRAKANQSYIVEIMKEKFGQEREETLDKIEEIYNRVKKEEEKRIKKDTPC